MDSMTGYGRGAARRDGREITVELKAVNHRFLDLSFRAPKNLSFLEDAFRSFLNESGVRRGMWTFSLTTPITGRTLRRWCWIGSFSTASARRGMIAKTFWTSARSPTPPRFSP